MFPQQHAALPPGGQLVYQITLGAGWLPPGVGGGPIDPGWGIPEGGHIWGGPWVPPGHPAHPIQPVPGQPPGIWGGAPPQIWGGPWVPPGTGPTPPTPPDKPTDPAPEGFTWVAAFVPSVTKWDWVAYDGGEPTEPPSTQPPNQPPTPTPHPGAKK